jgi:membrane fusion protein, multidrug efflux system
MKLILVSLSSAIIFFSCSSGRNEEKKTSQPGSDPARVETARVETGGLTITQQIPAQLAAFQEVSIYPKVNGFIKDVFVDIGSAVRKDQVLLQLEAPELMQEVIQAKEKYEKAKADYSLDKDKYHRLNEAARTSGAISPYDLASAQSRMNADSSLVNAEKASWKFQETMVGYLHVTAPFDGVITERNVHPGALVSATDKSKPMLELKEINHLRLQADVAESVAVQLKTGDTVSYILKALPGKQLKGVIGRISKNITNQLQAERIEADVFNPDNQLIPGMFAELTIKIKGTPGAFTLPKSAVVTTTERKYVVVVKGGVNVKTDVTTGNETAGKIEVFGSLTAGDEVIVNPGENDNL